MNMYRKGNMFTKYMMVFSASGFVAGTTIAYNCNDVTITLKNGKKINKHANALILGMTGAIIMPAIPFLLTLKTTLKMLNSNR